MTETSRPNFTPWYKVTVVHVDHDPSVPPPILGERRSVIEAVILAAIDIGQRVDSIITANLAVMGLDRVTTPEDLPHVITSGHYTWTIDQVHGRSSDEHLTISVGRDTAKEARDALAWFQLGQSEPVTLDVEEGCLAVYLVDGILSIGVDGTENATVWYKPHGEEGYEFGAIMPAGFGLDEEEQTEFCEIVDGLMGNLAGFHYLAGGAAVRAIVAEGRA